VEQVAQRSCDCPLPGSVQGQVGWSSEQPGLAKDVPADGRGVGTRWSLRSVPTLTIVWFYDSLILLCSVTREGWHAAEVCQQQRCNQCYPLPGAPALLLTAPKAWLSLLRDSSASRKNTQLLLQSGSLGRGISPWQRRVTKNISVPLHHTVCCHWYLSDVLLAKGESVVESKVFAAWWERAGGGSWPSEARKGKKGSIGEGEEERQKGDEDYLWA